MKTENRQADPKYVMRFMLGGLWVCPISVWREGVAMRIVTLIENTSCQASLCCEHGLSLYIETGKHRILFDAGQTGAFADNAEKLGIDLRTVDLAVLSHGHYDHGGGLKRFLEINHTAPVYLSRNAFGAYYNGTQKYIGLDSAIVVGAIVAGAYVGDKLSPFSDGTNLAASVAGADLFKMIKEMFGLFGVIYIICIIVYVVIGLGLPVADAAEIAASIDPLQEAIAGNFKIGVFSCWSAPLQAHCRRCSYRA